MKMPATCVAASPSSNPCADECLYTDCPGPGHLHSGGGKLRRARSAPDTTQRANEPIPQVPPEGLWIIQREVRERPAADQRAKPLPGRQLSTLAQRPERTKVGLEVQPTDRFDWPGRRHRHPFGVVVRHQRNVEAGLRDHLLAEDGSRIDFHQHQATTAFVSTKLHGRRAAMPGNGQQLQAQLGNLGVIADLLQAGIPCTQGPLTKFPLGSPAETTSSLVYIRRDRKYLAVLVPGLFPAVRQPVPSATKLSRTWRNSAAVSARSSFVRLKFRHWCASAGFM